MSTSEKKISIAWQFLELCFSWKKFIGIVTGIFVVLGVALAFLLPKEYEGIATVLPSQKSSLLGLLGMGGGGGAVSSLARQFAPLVGGGTQIGTGFNYLAILNSREAMQRVVNKFDLKRVYSISDSSIQKTIKELRSNVNFDIDEYGEVVVEVFDKSPVRAAAMANYFVAILNEVNGKLSSEDARNIRVFLENRYEKNVRDLEAAEDSLKDFQQRNGAFSPPEQAKASIAAAADIESQILANQVKLSVLEKQMSSSAPEIQFVNDQIQALEKKLNEMNTGKGLKSGSSFSVLVPFKEVPNQTMRYLDLYREVELQAKLLEYIYPMYEQARLEEAKDTPTVLVLDHAIPPEKKARPLRALIVVSALVLGFVLSVLFAVFVTNGERRRDGEAPLEQRYYKLSMKMIRKLNPAALTSHKSGN